MIKLLLVEDDPNLCYIVQSGLQELIGGYEVYTASNGKEGLEVWKNTGRTSLSATLICPKWTALKWSGASAKQMEMFLSSSLRR